MRLKATAYSDQAERYLRSGGPWDIPCLDTLLSSAPSRDGALIVDGTLRLTSAEVEQRVSTLAGQLRSSGVEHGDVVAWMLPNGAPTVLLSRACWRLGAIAAPLHHRSGPGEIDEMLSLLEPRVMVAEPDALPDALPDAGPPVTEGVAVGEDLALVQFTSGSTGTPKAVLHSHRSLGAKTVQMIAAHGLGPTDSTLVQSPISHISGMLNGVLVPGVAGMRHVLLDRWNAGAALCLIRDEAVSFMVGPPTVFLSLMDAPDFSAELVDTLRVVSCGATGITPEFVEHASETLGAEVKRSYGCTEAPTVTTSAFGDPVDLRVATDGRPFGDTEIRIVDPESGCDVEAGAEGEILVRGPELFAGYALAAQTDTALVDGWFRTGDLGRSNNGWLTLVGRLKDVIIRGGENVAPAEVERVLERHPSVRHAVVVGVADERLGERVAAFVVGDVELDAVECAGWFVEQGVARFKSPELVINVDTLPLLSLGKPDRAALREQAAQIIEAEE